MNFSPGSRFRWSVCHSRSSAARALVRHTLSFVRTQRGADRLAKSLRAQGFRVGALHGGMSQPQRERALGRFASGANDVLVATDVAARGLDLDDITHVINFDAPADEKDYVHRVGRTARAGRGGEGITFVTPEQERDVSRIAAKLDLRGEFTGAGLRMDRPRAVGGADGVRRRGGRPTPLGARSRGRRRAPRRRPGRPSDRSSRRRSVLATARSGCAIAGAGTDRARATPIPGS